MTAENGYRELYIPVFAPFLDSHHYRRRQVLDVFQQTRMSGRPCGVLPERVAVCLAHCQVLSSTPASLLLVFTDVDGDDPGASTSIALPILSN